MSTAKRLVATLRGRKNSSPCGETGIGCNSSSSTRLFSSNPRCSVINNNNSNSNNELDEIAIVSNAEPCQVKYGSGPLHSAANGPRLVPGMYRSKLKKSNLQTFNKKYGTCRVFKVRVDQDII